MKWRWWHIISHNLLSISNLQESDYIFWQKKTEFLVAIQISYWYSNHHDENPTHVCLLYFGVVAFVRVKCSVRRILWPKFLYPSISNIEIFITIKVRNTQIQWLCVFFFSPFDDNVYWILFSFPLCCHIFRIRRYVISRIRNNFIMKSFIIHSFWMFPFGNIRLLVIELSMCLRKTNTKWTRT